MFHIMERHTDFWTGQPTGESVHESYDNELEADIEMQDLERRYPGRYFVTDASQ
ncbi:hypothetical protein KPL76_06335 [Subtercola sp. PAMC28395]|uniref:hypothetical protein n=1 Tax=Subtercola sp. PAMC28395 TaxID=2846775 RepID=UPI001C0AF0A6|nr:hypothetical protein [Subtercola sp. PAMC28395]QWT24971.1 hypothetical protein KPL76_06335 [Subtercola sp. PAMC28395]